MKNTSTRGRKYGEQRDDSRRLTRTRSAAFALPAARARRKRPRRRTAEERDELSPSHVRHGTSSQHKIGAADGPTRFSAR